MQPRIILSILLTLTLLSVSLAFPSSKPVSQTKKLDQLLKMVQANKAQGCVQKIICELRVNEKKYGSDGIKFGDSLIELGELDHPSINRYRTASDFGSRFKNEKRCEQEYKCELDVSKVIRLGNAVLKN